jgi:signal transduction histidine kinase
MLNFTDSKIIDFLEGIYWGLSIGIGILLLVLIVKWLLRKQNESNKLKEHNLSLIKANNSLERFTHIISHNLRAPVTNLISLTELQRDNSLTNESKAEISDKIHECVIQLDSTLNDLVEVIASKSESTKSETLNFEKEFDQVLKSIENQVKQSGIQLETDFTASPQIHFPKHFLNSIMLNLLTNSIKYKSNDRKLMVQIKTENKMGQTILHFSDNGIGIDLKKFGDKLFGLYQRFHSEIEGKGMGLYIIKSQVEAMGGRIELDSIPNQGTSFRIYFNSQKEA